MTFSKTYPGRWSIGRWPKRFPDAKFALTRRSSVDVVAHQHQEAHVGERPIRNARAESMALTARSATLTSTAPITTSIFSRSRSTSQARTASSNCVGRKETVGLSCVGSWVCRNRKWSSPTPTSLGRALRRPDGRGPSAKPKVAAQGDEGFQRGRAGTKATDCFGHLRTQMLLVESCCPAEPADRTAGGRAAVGDPDVPGPRF